MRGAAEKSAENLRLAASHSGYHRTMTVIRISRSEAENNFEGILARAAGGDIIHIESDARVIARLLPGDSPEPRLLSDSLKVLSAWSQRNFGW